MAKSNKGSSTMCVLVIIDYLKLCKRVTVMYLKTDCMRNVPR